MKFSVKKNPILILIIIALLPLSFFILITSLSKGEFISGLVGFFISFLLFLFLTYPIIKSYHEITETHFQSIFGAQKIDIPLEDITKVHYTWNPVSAPAWTFKRMKVSYGHYGFELLSIPKDEEQFFTLLKEKCPNILIEVNKKE